MIQCLLTADALGGIEAKHLAEEINGKRISLREETREGDAGFDWEGANVVLGLRNSGELIKKFQRSGSLHGENRLDAKYPLMGSLSNEGSG